MLEGLSLALSCISGVIDGAFWGEERCFRSISSTRASHYIESEIVA
jgi:hypothetical protein